MLLVREIMFCKPGKVKALTEKFLKMNEIGKKIGMPPMRVMTDFAAERFWMLVGEMEVESVAEFENWMGASSSHPEVMKEFEAVMKDYHDLVVSGRREIYKIEG
ncbi:MAG TPA: hypothetical protein VJ992_07790 [Gemmatimonadales bacterium]|nr:hypothetical protein [Gemmatimonadales bacterium]